ncbi:MAG: hypothetical protein AMJ56_17260 [Anaerolineae bacterium SG8_19]|nr:MAG: hypothetical protein AMJ56_17260 [Anaerolineae bacterium SG8_19]
MAELAPQLKALRTATSALNRAARLAAAEKADALPMQRALTRLEAAAENVESETLDSAVAAFAAATQAALDDLAFDFASDLREEFAARGETVEGRPPVLTVGILTLRIDIAARKGQWFYGKEPLTKPIPLSLTGILKAYDQQVNRAVNRTVDADEFVPALKKAWQDCIDKRTKRPGQGRVNIIEVYSQLTLNQQSVRFWNQPSRRTFRDYDRVLFVRDLVLVHEQGATDSFRLGVATKSQAEQASRSIWLPDTAIDGQYYSDITFD